MTSAVTQTAPLATAYDLDVAHSSAEFAIKHMMIATVRGRIPIANATIVRGPDGYEIEAQLDIARIDTGAKDRDDHLRSPDFFDVGTFPHITFRAQGVPPDAEHVPGELTIRDVTRPVTLHVERGGEGVDPWGKKRVGISATTTLDRQDFGLKWNAALEAGGVLVGDKVKVTLDLQAVERT